MPAYRARAEFRRASTTSPWVLAGVIVGDRFWPAVPEVQPVRTRLPAPGLQGWAPLEQPVLAPDMEAAAATALGLARDRWPDRVRADVPFAAGTGD